MLKQLCAVLAATSIFAAPAAADEASVKKAMQQFLGPNAQIDSVKKTDRLGLYEVVVGGDILYTDEAVSNVILGEIYDARTRNNVTQERLNKLSTIDFSSLPLELAIKTVRGDGKRVIATLEDPRCGYCKKLAKELQRMTNITVYTFMVPVLGPESVNMAKAIWCAADRSETWNAWMINGKEPPAVPENCDASALTRSTALGQQLRLRGTPTIFLPNGERIPGFARAADLEQRLAALETR